MHKTLLVMLSLCFPLIACSTVPAYEEATGKGPEESRVLVKEIVGRVKCELPALLTINFMTGICCGCRIGPSRLRS